MTNSVDSLEGYQQERARRKVEESETLLASTLERISDAFFSVDATWRFTYLNSHVERLLGKSKRDMIGKSLWEEFPAFNEPAFRTRYEQAMKTQQPRFFEEYSPLVDHWFRVHAYPSRDGLSVYYTDVTNEKRDRGILARQARLLEQSHDAIFAWELHGPIIYWNKGAEDLYGYTKDQALGVVSHTLLRTTHPGGTDLVEKAIGETGVWEGELVHISRSGKELTIESRHQLIRDPDGRAVVLEINRDITERKRAQERAQLLSRLSELVRLADEPDELTWAAATLVGEHMRVRRCFFADIDIASDRGNVQRDYCIGVPSIAGPYRVSSYSSSTQQEIQAGHTVINCDSKLDERTARFYDSTYKPVGERSYVAVPLIRDKVWVGTFWVSDDVPRQWTTDEVMLLEVVAERVWVALEKLRSDRTLLNSTAQFATLLNEAPLGVYLVDADFRIQQVNPTAQALFGGITNLIGRDFAEVMHILWTKQHADEIVRIFRHTLETGEAYTEPESIEKRLDLGATEYYEWQVDRIQLPDGRYGVVCYFRDISVQVRAREAIAESEERYRGIVNQSVAGIAETDASGRFTMVNDRYCEITGYPRRELLLMRRHEITYSEDLPHSLENFERLAAGGPGFEIVKRYVRKDCSLAWVHNSVSAIRDASGVVRSLITVAIDITERTLAQDKIRQSEEQLRAMFDTTTVGFAIMTPDTFFTQINDAFCEITGYSREELLDMDFQALTHPDDKDVLKEKVEELVAGTIPSFVLEKQFRRKGGEIIWVQTSVSLVHAAGNTPHHLIAICQDTTERKKLEQRKDDFIALASHELKTPITSLKMSTQLLKRRLNKDGASAGSTAEGSATADSFVEKQLTRMDDQLNKLTDLVNDLLDVSKIEAGKLNYQMENVEVDVLIRECVEELRPVSDKHSIVITDLAPVMVTCDKDRIGQVLTNLIANAIKFSPEADRVIVSSEAHDGNVTVSVQDFGIGIPEGEQDRIFERFFQVRRPGLGGGTYPGLGLGLYISSQMIKSHGGSLWVESKPGTGSTFRFTLPLAPT